MRVRMALHRQSGTSDITVDTEPEATVGLLAAELQRCDPEGAPSWNGHRPTLARYDGSGWQVLSPAATMSESGLMSGVSITIAPAPDVPDGDAIVATLRVLSGPGVGAEFPLTRGAHLIGRDRDCDVHLRDPMVSKRHARVVVTDVIEIVDLNSSNGLLVGGERVSRLQVESSEVVLLGDTEIAVTHRNPRDTKASHLYNRSPLLAVRFVGKEEKAPEIPTQQEPQAWPLVSMLVPLLMGGFLIGVVDVPVIFAVFIALSPLMILGTVIESRWSAKRAYAKARARFRGQVAELDSRLADAAAKEMALRQIENPATYDVAKAIKEREPLLWSRRPNQEEFLQLRLGLGRLPSRTTVDSESAAPDDGGLYQQLMAVVTARSFVDGVPVVADLRRDGALGLAGPLDHRLGVARGTILQLVGLHTPAEVVLAAVMPAAAAMHWSWLAWLPHTFSEHHALGPTALANNPEACARLVSALEGLASERATSRAAHGEVPSLPAIVVLVENNAPVDRGRLVQLAETGRDSGIHVIWCADGVTALPAACRTFLEVSDGENGRVGYADPGLAVTPVSYESVPAEAALRRARVLAPVVDVGAMTDEQSDLPRSVAFLDLGGPDLGRSSETVIDRWRLSNSLPPDPSAVPSRRTRDNNLRALIGESGGNAFYLDLREHGPHALVGGTTGAGKSELLQSWVLGMATAHSPRRVTFLFVDYKGGAAFGRCTELPHNVGLVTDLSPRLVQRALTSLKAELKYRERILQASRAKDLLEMERSCDPTTPPSLVIVVDEFAALAKEVPEFVDGVVDVAQRGRSLGLHLILATQRPAGVIKDSLRANTNLRVALRMNDEDDSLDVIGSADAAGFDPGIPGRGAARTGPGRLVPFQSAYVGGWTTDEAKPPTFGFSELGFGLPAVWESPEDQRVARAPVDPGPNDLTRIVDTVRAAALEAGISSPRRPWRESLAATYDLAELQTTRTDTELVFGQLDDPEAQDQYPIAFHPDRDGSMAVYGTGGTGKSGFLRTLAIAAAGTRMGGPCQVYGLDFGSRGLAMLEPLPHVGSIVAGDDAERVSRLLRQLRDEVDRRAQRYTAVNASTIVEYRRLAQAPNEPRIVLLVDGIGAFRQAYESTRDSALFDLFQSLAVDGRATGVHLVVSADRPGAVPTMLASSIQRRLVLKQASVEDLGMLGLKADAFDLESPPGRGYIEGREVQVAVLGGSASVAEQASHIARLAGHLRGVTQDAPPIGRLVENVTQAHLPRQVDGRPLLGVAQDTLEPIGFRLGEVLLVAGPPQSGRTTAVAALVASARRCLPGLRCVYLGVGRSPLPELAGWDVIASGVDAVREAADRLTREVKDGAYPSGSVLVVVENVPELLGSLADDVVQDLVMACRNAEHTLIGEGPIEGMNSGWPLLGALRGPRHGLLLQPEAHEGDVLRTDLPRLRRSDFPPGRGVYVDGGRVRVVQVAVAD